MLVLTDMQKVDLSISPKSAAGNPALVDGMPTWFVSDEKVLSLTISDDGMSATAMATGVLGTSQISVEVDADLGEGVRSIVGVLVIEVKASEAVSLDVNAGTPSDK